MSKKYVVRRGFLSFMTGVVGLSAMLGFAAGRNLPQETKDDHQVATEIRMFIEDAIEDGEDIETIKHEANKMAKKHAMVVGFGYDNTVGIYKNLVTEEYPISSFSIGADKTSIH